MQNAPSTQEFSFEYDATELPPPYAHFLKVSGSVLEDAVLVNTEFHYTDREELSEEDILAEGFSDDDDFTWSGELPIIWKSVLDTLPSLPKSDKWDSIATISIEVIDKFQGSQVIRNDNRYYYFLQELLQASLEKSGREKPLEINYSCVQKGDIEHTNQYTFFFSFTDRVAKFSVSKGSKVIMVDWELAQTLLKKIFMLDYLQELADESLPPVEGDYIDPGDSLWYKFNHAAVNPGKKDVSKSLKEEFANLIDSLKH